MLHTNKIPPWLEFTGNEKPTPIKCGWAHRVRQVLSADTLRIALLKPKYIHCPLDPPEVIHIELDGIIAPKCQIMEGKSDDPYAYEAREFVRDKILNKNIFYAAWRRSIKSQKFRGDIYYQDDVTKITKSLTNELVANGYAKLKDRQTYLSTIESNRLKQQMSHAMKKKLNVWSGDHKNYTRNIEWISYTSNDQTEFGEKYKNKILHGVVEEVITGSIIKVELLIDKNQNEFKSVIVNIAGINCPKPPLFSSNKKSRNRRRSLNRTTPRLDALFGIKSREWTEDRLLGQTVDVKILHVSNKDIFAQIMHEKGKIAPSLLSKGLAQFEIWTAKLYDASEQNVLIAARDVAQKQRLNIWTIQFIQNTHAFTEQIAKVIKVISGDTVEVINEKDKKEICKLSSIRAPRPGHFHISDRYDVGDEYLAYDAKEFVRQKCIGKTVRLVIEYFCVRREKRPFVSIYVKNDNGNEENIAVELIKRGLAELSCGKIHCEDYALLESEFHKAFKNRVGLNAYVKWDKYRNTYVTDYDRRTQKAKETLISDYSITTRDKCGNSLQYKIFSLKACLINKLIKGVIDSILSGTTLKVYIPLKKAYIAVRLAIIRGCEQGKKYLQQTILQRDIAVQIISHSIDNGYKNKRLYLFNGHIYLNGNNISEDLLTHGFASVVESNINNNNNNVVTKSFYKCEQYAKCNKLGVWQHIHQLYSDTEMNQWQKTSKTGDEIDVMISYIESAIIFWVHDANLISTITTMNHEMENLTFNATIPRVIRVPVGKRVRYAAKYKESYGRVRVIKRSESKSENGKREWVVMFIDYGNKACVPGEHFAVLMSRLRLSRIPALANKCELAGITLDKSNMSYCDATGFFSSLTWESTNKKLKMKILYDDVRNNIWYVELWIDNQSINQRMAMEGYVKENRNLPLSFFNKAEYGKPWNQSHILYCQKYFDTIKANIKLAQTERKNIWKHCNTDDT